MTGRLLASSKHSSHMRKMRTSHHFMHMHCEHVVMRAWVSTWGVITQSPWWGTGIKQTVGEVLPCCWSKMQVASTEINTHTEQLVSNPITSMIHTQKDSIGGVYIISWSYHLVLLHQTLEHSTSNNIQSLGPICIPTQCISLWAHFQSVLCTLYQGKVPLK